MIDANKIDLKKEFELINQKSFGKQRAADLKYAQELARNLGGQEAVDEIDKAIKNTGFEFIDFSKYDDMEWVLMSYCSMYFVAMVKVLKLNEEQLIDLGKKRATAPSTATKLFIKYFLSPEKTIKIATKRINKFYTTGKAELVKLDLKNKILILQLSDIWLHRFNCYWNLGVFGKVVEIATGWEFIEQKETKCIHRGDSFCEYYFKGK